MISLTVYTINLFKISFFAISAEKNLQDAYPTDEQAELLQQMADLVDRIEQSKEKN